MRAVSTRQSPSPTGSSTKASIPRSGPSATLTTTPSRRRRSGSQVRTHPPRTTLARHRAGGGRHRRMGALVQHRAHPRLHRRPHPARSRATRLRSQRTGHQSRLTPAKRSPDMLGRVKRRPTSMTAHPSARFKSGQIPPSPPNFLGRGSLISGDSARSCFGFSVAVPTTCPHMSYATVRDDVCGVARHG